MPQAVSPLPSVRRSGVIQFDEKKCLACRECEVACSLAHEGECNPSLSRVRISFDDFVPGLPSATVCKQCDWPACYYACASRWDPPSIRIDEQTGSRAIDQDLCRGCGSCQRACPLSPEHNVIAYKQIGRRRKYFKCDLCSGREGGPVCVRICPGKALTFIPAEERSRR